MSSDNASSAVTYTSVSSDSNRPSSWGIPLVTAGELPKMDSYEEVVQQGQAHLLSPAYVPDPMKLDEHVHVYVPEPEHPEYHVPSDDDIQAEDQPYADDASPTTESPGYIADSDSIENDTDTDSIDYLDNLGTDNEDPKDEEDPSEEHDPKDKDEDPEEDPSEEHDLEDEDEDPEEDPSEEHEIEDADAKEDEPFEDSDETEPFEENETAATPPPPRLPQTRACIAEHAATPIPPTSPTYNQAPLGHRAAMICMRDDILEEDMPSWRRFVLTAPPPGCDSYHDARTIARAADRVEDVGYVRSLQASEHMMTTFIEEVNLRVSYQAQVRRKESEIFYTQLHNARTKGINIRLEIDVVRGQRTAYETEFAIRQGTNDAITPESIQAIIDRAIQRNSTQDDGSQSSGGGIRRPMQPARICSYPDFMKCQPLNFKGTEGNVGLS
ncbi:hypothetical protein Tco_0199422 [Tanacetum coccineum]